MDNNPTENPTTNDLNNITDSAENQSKFYELSLKSSDFNKEKSDSILASFISDENYFSDTKKDQELVDILEKYKKMTDIISTEKFGQIKILFEKFLEFSENGFNQTMYPYLSNSIKSFVSSLTEQEEQKLFILLLLLKQNNLEEKLVNFFSRISQVSLYEVPQKILKSNISKEEYYLKSIVKELSNWNAKVELILFYIEVLEQYYNIRFKFEKDIFSFDKNFKGSSNSAFVRTLFLKAAGTICDFVKPSPKVDKNKFMAYAIILVTSGFNFGVASVFFPWGEITGLAKTIGMNKILNKIKENLFSASNNIETNEYLDMINRLNSNLDKIKINLYEIIKLEMQEEMNDDLTKSKCLIINGKIKEVISHVEVYLKGVDYDYDIDKKVKEEYVEISKDLSEREIEDDWLYTSMKITEKNKRNKNGNEEKLDESSD